MAVAEHVPGEGPEGAQGADDLRGRRRITAHLAGEVVVDDLAEGVSVEVGEADALVPGSVLERHLRPPGIAVAGVGGLGKAADDLLALALVVGALVRVAVIAFVAVVGVRGPDGQERRTRRLAGRQDGSDLRPLAYGQRAPELLDRRLDLDDVLVREQAALEVHLAGVERRAEVRQRRRVAVLRERAGSELHVLPERPQENLEDPVVAGVKAREHLRNAHPLVLRPGGCVRDERRLQRQRAEGLQREDEGAVERFHRVAPRQDAEHGLDSRGGAEIRQQRHRVDGDMATAGRVALGQLVVLQDLDEGGDCA